MFTQYRCKSYCKYIHACHEVNRPSSKELGGGGGGCVDSAGYKEQVLASEDEV